MERMPKAALEAWEPEDVIDELKESQPELLKYFRLLPESLWSRHFDNVKKIAETAGNDNSAGTQELQINYILGIVESREKAITTYGASDPTFEKIISSAPDAFGELMRDTLLSSGNTLGAGMTARAKQARIEGYASPIAIKYLLTPTQKTLSVDGEYDMLREVETVRHIEDVEHKLGAGEHIRVPHPLFYFKRGKIQCYGMSLVNGMTLQEFVNDAKDPLMRDQIMTTLRSRYGSAESQKNLYSEIELFMKAVHEVCLHGDVKMGNLMIDTDGLLYLIDFGQSVAINAMSEETRDQFENVSADEVGRMTECVRSLFNSIR